MSEKQKENFMSIEKSCPKAMFGTPDMRKKIAAPEVEKQSNTIQGLALAVKAPVFNI